MSSWLSSSKADVTSTRPPIAGSVSSPASQSRALMSAPIWLIITDNASGPYRVWAMACEACRRTRESVSGASPAGVPSVKAMIRTGLRSVLDRAGPSSAGWRIFYAPVGR